MFGTIRSRLTLMPVLVGISIIYLYPRERIIRERGPDGVMRDVKVTGVPIKYGLDLQGGMHLGLELDQSQKPSPDPRGNTKRAIQVLRRGTEGLGVGEPLIQQV